MILMLLITHRVGGIHLGMISILYQGILISNISKNTFNADNGFNQILLAPNSTPNPFIFLIIVTIMIVWFDLGWILRYIHILGFFCGTFWFTVNSYEIIYMCENICVHIIGLGLPNPRLIFKSCLLEYKLPYSISKVVM